MGMKLSDWVPFVISTGNPISAILTGARHISGWTVLIFTQTIFVTYGVLTHQYGFALQAIMIVIAFNNWITWKRQEQLT